MRVPVQISYIRRSMLSVRCSTFLRGFTLIELLVSMAITTVLMLALFSLVGQSTTSYTQTQRAVNTVSRRAPSSSFSTANFLLAFPPPG